MGLSPIITELCPFMCIHIVFFKICPSASLAIEMNYSKWIAELVGLRTVLLLPILLLYVVCSASTLVIVLFLSHNYDFLPKKVIEMLRFSEKIILFGHFRCFNEYFNSVIIFQLFFIASNSSSNSVCFMLSCINGYRNVNIMDLTDITTSV